MQHQQQNNATTTTNTNFTNTAKLPIDMVKKLIASVSRRPNLWIRTTNNGQKRSDINVLWQQVSQEVHLPAEICRIKWGHLRDNFRKVFIRNTLSAEPPTTWRFYNDMRFMEPAVAENVMRHHRLREQSFYWQELHNAGQRQQRAATTTTTLPEAAFDHPIQNQFNFSEFAAMFQNNPPNNKRIKLEASESSETSLQDSIAVSMNSFQKDTPMIHSIHNHADLNGLEEDDDDDDDQFDEDAVSADENFQNDNDKEMTKKSLQNIDDINRFNKINIKNFKMHQEMSTNANTETCLESSEEDSDRMFLLSLLPYLRKVKNQRKLQVRQKLQDVLIEEFG